MSVIPELYDGCYLKCVLCWNRNRTPSFKGMKMETVKRITELFSGYRFDWYNWGDPILHPEFLHFAKLVKNTKSAISSPFCIKLTDRYLEAIRSFRIVYCSLSGMTKEAYNIYNRKGNFDTAINNIRTIAKNRKYRVVLNWQVHPQNMFQFEQAKAFAEELNIEFNPFTLNCEVEDLLDGIENMSDQEKGLLRAPNDKPNIHRCPLLTRTIPIDIDGNFLLCCASHNVKIGISINDNFTFDDIFKAKARTELCQRCMSKEHWRFFL